MATPLTHASLTWLVALSPRPADLALLHWRREEFVGVLLADGRAVHQQVAVAAGQRRVALGAGEAAYVVDEASANPHDELRGRDADTAGGAHSTVAKHPEEGEGGGQVNGGAWMNRERAGE